MVTCSLKTARQLLLITDFGSLLDLFFLLRSATSSGQMLSFIFAYLCYSMECSVTLSWNIWKNPKTNERKKTMIRQHGYSWQALDWCDEFLLHSNWKEHLSMIFGTIFYKHNIIIQQITLYSSFHSLYVPWPVRNFILFCFNILVYFISCKYCVLKICKKTF